VVLSQSDALMYFTADCTESNKFVINRLNFGTKFSISFFDGTSLGHVGLLSLSKRYISFRLSVI